MLFHCFVKLPGWLVRWSCEAILDQHGSHGDHGQAPVVKLGGQLQLSLGRVLALQMRIHMDPNDRNITCGITKESVSSVKLGIVWKCRSRTVPNPIVWKSSLARCLSQEPQQSQPSQQPGSSCPSSQCRSCRAPRTCRTQSRRGTDPTVAARHPKSSGTLQWNVAMARCNGTLQWNSSSLG